MKMNPPLDWLLEGEPWIDLRTRLDLLGQSPGHPQVRSARQAMLADERVTRLVMEVAQWPGEVLTSHKSAGHLIHKLTFLADLGFTEKDPVLAWIVERLLAHRSPEGPFQVLANIPVHYGGSGRDEFAWALCDAPLVLYALGRFGLQKEPSVQAALDSLLSLVRENGWPCVVSKEMGSFHGPGRREDPCPFATLAMLKAASAFEEARQAPACHAGVDTLLDLWADSLTRHPYIFYMGTDFRKLKVPFVWYDLLHVLDVLSHFPWTRNDRRFLDMLAVLESRMDAQGRFTPESVWMAWKDWEFGQKKVPSRWLTLCAWRVLRTVSP